MIPIDTFLGIAKTFAAAVLKLAEVTTSVDVIYSAAKRVRSFVAQKMRKEIFLLILIQSNDWWCLHTPGG